MKSGSIPEMTLRRVVAGRRGLLPATIRAMAAIWAGVVPQHPPTTLSHPSSTKRASFFARESGVSP